METRANYTQVGAFVILGFVGAILFILWLNKTSLGTNQIDYNIFFKGSVSGLKKSSVVQYRGVPIGLVTDVAIDHENVEQVRVMIRIDSNVPIKEDSKASLESQGLTGISYIQINGGTQDSPVLKAKKGEKYPIIPSKQSLLEQVAGSVPELLVKFSNLADEIRGLFTDENKTSFTETMKNLAQITDFFRPQLEDKDSFLVELNSAIAAADDTFFEIQKTSAEFRKIMEDNRQGLKDFSTNGLSGLSNFLNEGRETLSTIRRIGEAIERSPSRFFYNDPKQGVPTR